MQCQSFIRKITNWSPSFTTSGFPPAFSCWGKFVCIVGFVLFICGVFGVLFYCCGFIISLFNAECCIGPNRFGYPLGVCGISGSLLYLVSKFDMKVHDSRLEDPSVVKALLVEAKRVEPRIKDKDLPSNCEFKEKKLGEEVDQLENDGLNCWTEYQVLNLRQNLVDFWDLDTLISSAQSILEDLYTYASDSNNSYDMGQYYTWKTKIEHEVEKIEQEIKASGGAGICEKIDSKGERLRAHVKTLYDHIANFQMVWAEGTTLLKYLCYFTISAMLFFLFMGLVPLFCDSKELNVINWSFLGASGSLCAVLMSLRKYNKIEVGDSEGNQEIRRAMYGCVLGLVAGLLSYYLISAGIISGPIFPDLTPSPDLPIDLIKLNALSIITAFVSGFSFDKIFDKIRGHSFD